MATGSEIHENPLPSDIEVDSSLKTEVVHTDEVTDNTCSNGENTFNEENDVEEAVENMDATEQRREENVVPEEDGFTEEENKLWSVVQETPTDFNTWTQLLQLVEQRAKLSISRQVFDTFLSHYPNCYGYWKKYADLEQKLADNDSTIQVLEQSVAAIPLSVDLWLYYIKFIQSISKQDPEYTNNMRSFYERAVGSCGLEYRSDKLWSSYIEWESENGSFPFIVALYDRLLATPTQQYQQHFENFKNLVSSVSPVDLLSSEEYQELVKEVEKTEDAEEKSDEEANEEKEEDKVTEERSEQEESTTDTQLQENKTNETEMVENTETEDTETEMVEKPETEMVEKPGTEMVENTEIQMVEKPETEMVANTEIQMVEKPGTEMVEKSETEMVEKPGTEMVENTEIQMVEKPETEMVEKPGTEMVENTEIQMVEKPETEMVANTEIQMVEKPGTEMVGNAGTEMVENAETEMVENKELDITVTIQQKIVEKRLAVFILNEAEVNKRKKFEELIKRPYFHTKPLEKTQLKNWLDYLDFEISLRDMSRIVVLFERCLIACCLYEDFWLKFAKFVEDYYTTEYTESVYSRACQIHLQHKPNIHLAWAAYKEKQGDIDGAKSILSTFNSRSTGHVFVKLREIGLEMRQGNLQSADALLSQSVSEAKDNDCRSFFVWRHANLVAKRLNDFDRGISILKEGIENDRGNEKLYYQLLDLELARTPVSEEKVDEVFSMVEKSDSLSEDTKRLFQNRRVQFLEEFSSDIYKISTVYQEYLKKQKKSNGLKRSASTSDDSSVNKKPKNDNTDISSQWSSYHQQWGGYNYTHQGFPYHQWPTTYQYQYTQQQQQQY